MRELLELILKLKGDVEFEISASRLATSACPIILGLPGTYEKTSGYFLPLPCQTA
jgi:hypothetical protein